MHDIATAALIWFSAHRILVIAFLAIPFWLAAYGWYHYHDYKMWRVRHSTHAWHVDLQNRTGKRGAGRG